MAQDVKIYEKDLSSWFEKEVEEYTKYVADLELQVLSQRIKEKAYDIENKLFKYVALKLMDRQQPPSSIDGLPYSSDPWEPLTENYIKRKKHSRKWKKTGDLIAYLEAKEPHWWYPGGSKMSVDKSNYVITYDSLFNNDRKEFGGDREEMKIRMNEPYRPVLEPMKDFLFDTKLDYEIDKLLEKWSEENYG